MPLVRSPPCGLRRDGGLVAGLAGGGSVGASEAARLLFGAGPLFRVSLTLDRCSVGSVSASGGKRFFRAIRSDSGRLGLRTAKARFCAESNRRTYVRARS